MKGTIYNTVFISHSKDDPNTDFFHQVFSQLDAKSIWMEFENISAPPFVSIRDQVNDSDALFVLLSDHLIGLAHTNNWVSFEVGLAANLNMSRSSSQELSTIGLPVWVFEPLDKDIHYTVPYCTHYMKYKSEPLAVRWLCEILEDPSSKGGIGVKLVCPNINCRLSFFYLSAHTKTLACPACRKQMKLSEGCDLYDEAQRLAEKVTKSVLENYSTPLSSQEVEQVKQVAMKQAIKSLSSIL